MFADDDQDGLGLELWSYALWFVNRDWAPLESQSHPPDLFFQGTGGDLTAECSTNISNNPLLTLTGRSRDVKSTNFFGDSSIHHKTY